LKNRLGNIQSNRRNLSHGSPPSQAALTCSSGWSAVHDIKSGHSSMSA